MVKLKINRSLTLIYCLFITSLVTAAAQMTILSSISLHNTLALNIPIVDNNKIEFALFGSTIMILMYPISIIISPIISSLSDFIGRKSILLVCQFVSIFALTTEIFGINLQSKAWMYFSFSLFSIAINIYPVLVASYLEEIGRKKMLNFLFIISTSYIILSLVAQLLSHLLAYNFISATNILLLCLILKLILIPFFKYFDTTKQSKLEKGSKDFLYDFSNQLSSFFAKKSIFLTIILILCFNFSWGLQHQDKYVIPIANHIIANHSILTFNIYSDILILFSIILIYPLITRFFSLKNVLSISVILLLISNMLSILFNHTILQMLTIFIANFINYFVFPILAFIFIRRHNIKELGFACGMFYTLDNLSWCFSSIVTFILHPFISNFTEVISFIALVFFIGILFIYFNLYSNKTFNIGTGLWLKKKC